MATAADDIVRIIKDGLLDEHLSELAQAIDNRVKMARMTRTASSYQIGDRVMVNSSAGTKYLHRMTGVITGKKASKVLFQLDKPTGRFLKYEADGSVRKVEISAPVSILDKIF